MKARDFMASVKRQEKDNYIGIKIDSDTKRRFEELAYSKNITVSQAIRNLMLLALEQAGK